MIIISEDTDKIKFINKSSLPPTCKSPLPPNWINDDDNDDIKSTTSTVSSKSANSKSSLSSSSSIKRMSKFVKTSCIKNYIINIPYSQRKLYKSKYDIKWDVPNQVWIFTGTKTQMPSALRKLCEYKTIE